MRHRWQVCLLVALIAGAAAAQPGTKPTRLTPRRPASADLLSGSSSGAGPLDPLAVMRPDDFFGPDGIITEGQLPRTVRRLSGQSLPTGASSSALKPGLAVRDLSKLDTSVAAHGKQIAVVRASQSIMDALRTQLTTVSVTPRSISAMAHGWYILWFDYQVLNPTAIKLPLRFKLQIDGDAKKYASYSPFACTKLPATGKGSGTIWIRCIGENIPLKFSCSQIGLTAFDGGLDELVTVTKAFPYEFTKSYDDITRDNIRDYLALPGKAQDTLALDQGAGNLTALQTEYVTEPALILVKTNRGDYAKALVRAVAGAGGSRHLEIWDARCYAKDQATFNSWPFMPGAGFSSNTEWVQDFGATGFLFNDHRFDFERDGVNTSAADADLGLFVYASGAPGVHQRIVMQPACKIAH